eukprot:1158174-Pelagomonas_calceolata.AAC.7
MVLGYEQSVFQGKFTIVVTAWRKALPLICWCFNCLPLLTCYPAAQLSALPAFHLHIDCVVLVRVWKLTGLIICAASRAR